MKDVNEWDDADWSKFQENIDENERWARVEKASDPYIEEKEILDRVEKLATRKEKLVDREDQVKRASAERAAQYQAEADKMIARIQTAGSLGQTPSNPFPSFESYLISRHPVIAGLAVIGAISTIAALIRLLVGLRRD